MKVFKAIFIFIIIVLGVLLFLELIPIAPEYHKENNPWKIQEGSRPLIIPHRGAMALYPENTIYAFNKIAEANYDVFEVDLVLTKDNVLISHHDIDLVNTTGDEDKIISLTYEEVVSKYQASSFAENFRDYNDEPLTDLELTKDQVVPATLEYLFTTYKNKKFILEIKDTRVNSGEEVFIKAVEELLNLIEKHHMNENVIIASFDDNVIQEIRDRNKEIMTSSGVRESAKFITYSLLRIDFFYRPKDAALILPYDLPIDEHLTSSQMSIISRIPKFIRNQVIKEENGNFYTDLAKKYIINDLHRHNVAVYFWTVNDKEAMKKLIELGVDGIITDRPDLLLTVYEELGLS